MSDTEKLVTISRLKTLLDAYGASPEYWPEEERAAATALIETSAEAHILLEEAAALDGLLDEVPEPEVSAALAIRVRSIGFPSVEPVSEKSVEARAGGVFALLQKYFRPQTPGALQGAAALAGVLGIVAGVGISSLVFDRAGETQQAVATATPVLVTNGVNTLEVAETNGVETASTSLTPDLTSLSLTGYDPVTLSDNAASGDDESQTDVGQFTVAGVPLY